MARRKNRASIGALEGILFLIVLVGLTLMDVISRHWELFAAIGIFLLAVIILFWIRKSTINRQRRELLQETFRLRRFKIS